MLGKELGTQGTDFYMYIYIFYLCRTACGILVPQLGIEPTPPAVEAQSFFFFFFKFIWLWRVLVAACRIF